MDAVFAGPVAGTSYEGPVAAERQLLANAKKLTLFAAGAAAQKYPTQLPEQQEIMAALADCIIQVYALESCILRTEKTVSKRGSSASENAVDCTSLYAAHAMEVIEAAVRKVIAAVAEGDMLRTQMAIVRRLSKYDPIDTIGVGRRVARRALSAS